ncbi:unnamed protein product, partial [Chrysoparadoxa australica]
MVRDIAVLLSLLYLGSFPCIESFLLQPSVHGGLLAQPRAAPIGRRSAEGDDDDVGRGVGEGEGDAAPSVQDKLKVQQGAVLQDKPLDDLLRQRRLDRLQGTELEIEDEVTNRLPELSEYLASENRVVRTREARGDGTSGEGERSLTKDLLDGIRKVSTERPPANGDSFSYGMCTLSLTSASVHLQPTQTPKNN